MDRRTNACIGGMIDQLRAQLETAKKKRREEFRDEIIAGEDKQNADTRYNGPNFGLSDDNR